MADQAHEAMVQQGVAEWNQWRQQCPEIWPDLSGSDFSGKDLTYANFSRCNLSGTDFRTAVLRQADFSRADLRNADISRADISYANFSNALLVGLRHSGTDRSKADFSGTPLDFQYRRYKRESLFSALVGKTASRQFLFIIIVIIVTYLGLAIKC